MSGARSARYKEFIVKMQDLEKSFRRIEGAEAYVKKVNDIRYKLSNDFIYFNIRDMEDLQDKLQELSALFKAGKIKKQIDAIRDFLYTLHATFGNLYLDISHFVELIGKTTDVSQSVRDLNECGTSLVLWTKSASMEQNKAVQVFKTLTDVMLVLQENKELRNNIRVKYMISFLQQITDLIEKFKDGKNKYAMHDHAKLLIGYYNPPPASNPQPVRAEVAYAPAQKPAEAEMTGGNVRIAGLLSELRPLGV